MLARFWGAEHTLQGSMGVLDPINVVYKQFTCFRIYFPFQICNIKQSQVIIITSGRDIIHPHMHPCCSEMLLWSLISNFENLQQQKQSFFVLKKSESWINPHPPLVNSRFVYIFRLPPCLPHGGLAWPVVPWISCWISSTELVFFASFLNFRAGDEPRSPSGGLLPAPFFSKQLKILFLVGVKFTV